MEKMKATIFIPTKLGVVKMDFEDRLKFPGKISAFHGMRKINIYIYHDKRLRHGHRLIMGVKRNDHVVDHKNGDRFDWRKKNLRVVTVRKNNVNKADYKKKSGLPRGVALTKSGKFSSIITVNRKAIYLGLFDCPLKAHDAFVKAHKKHHKTNSFYKRAS